MSLVIVYVVSLAKYVGPLATVYVVYLATVYVVSLAKYVVPLATVYVV